MKGKKYKIDDYKFAYRLN